MKEVSDSIQLLLHLEDSAKCDRCNLCQQV